MDVGVVILVGRSLGPEPELDAWYVPPAAFPGFACPAKTRDRPDYSGEFGARRTTTERGPTVTLSPLCFGKSRAAETDGS